MLFLDLMAAAGLLNTGGFLIYPTETFWALGCSILRPEAVAELFRLKGRNSLKPLPLIAASREQAGEYVDLDAAPEYLLTKFWPGPLTLLLPAKIYLAPGLINPQHKAAMRVSSNRSAMALAKLAGCPLAATSANMAGKQPALTPAELDKTLLARCAASGLPWGILEPGQEARSSASLPSTIVEPLKNGKSATLIILRAGAIKKEEIMQQGWDVI